MMEDEPDIGKDNGMERNLGPQPLDAIMREHGLENHGLVELRPVDLSHKAVQRARKGRRLTPRMKLRITEVLNAALKLRGIEQKYATRELFSY
jgi:hypothetical protein